MRPVISCIVPAYNAEQYIEKCVKSILNQTFANFELILVDDGSTDSTGEICDSLTRYDARVKVLHKKNMGVSPARNDGICMSSGEWLTFIDADDWIEDTFFEKMLSIASAADDVIVCSQYLNTNREIIETDAKGETLSFDVSDKLTDLMGSAIVRPPSSPRLFHLLFRNGPIFTGPWCKLYRKKTITDNHIEFNSILKIGEDNLFNLSFLSVAKKGKFIDVPLYHYRIEANSAFHDIQKKIDNWPDYFELISPMVEKYMLKEFFYHKIATEISRLISSSNTNRSKAETIAEIKKFCNNRYCKEALVRCHIKNFRGVRTKLTVGLLKLRLFNIAYGLYH